MERLFTSDVWNSAASSFLESIFNKSGSTQSLERYTAVLRAFFGSSPERSPESYTRFDVESYLARPSTSRRNYGLPIGPGTRNQRLAIVSSFYRYCSTYTITGADGQPATILQRLPPTVGMSYGHPPKRYRALTIPEVQALFSVIGHDVRGLRDRTIYLFLLLTAKRRTEVTSLSWGSIEQGEHLAFRYFPKGSSRQEKRQELPQECYDALIEYLTASNRLSTIRPEDPLFVGLPPRNGGNFRNVGKRLSGHAVNFNLKQYCKLAGLADPERISVHSLRHSSARLRVQAGQELTSISRILGHKSLVTTQTYVADLISISDPGLPLLAKSLPFLYSGHIQ